MLILMLLLALFPAQQALSQEAAPPDLTPAQQQAVIHEVSKLMNENYIFPETDKKNGATDPESIQKWRSHETDQRAQIRGCQETLKNYVGQYQERKVTLENGQLYYQRTGTKYRLIPMTNTVFAVEGLDYFRPEFATIKGGRASEVIGLYENGEKEPSKRSSNS